MSPVPPVAFQHLKVGYDGNLVLHDVSATISPGSAVAITGNNGSGKSTLLKACLGLTPIQGGAAELYGQQIGTAKQNRQIPWDRVGYVPQRRSSGGNLAATVREVVATGLLTARKWRVGRADRARVDQVLEKVGLAHRAAESFRVLSGGQQQRVLIARALVKSPDVLFMDEPLTGLDHHNREVLAQIMDDHRAVGGTALIVLHELGELAPLIDRELRIGSGHLVHDGPCTHPLHDDNAAYYRLLAESFAKDFAQDKGAI